MSRRGRLLVLLALVLAAALLAAQRSSGAPDPILILISFDGWRYDYADRVRAPNLLALAARGARAKALIPSFPTLTFPNHYTIVTGLYPAHHGIVANVMTDPSIGQRFTMSAETARDPRWWGGEPVWVTAIRQGRRAAAMFWPGAEVEIRGTRPTYGMPYVKALTSYDRARRVVEWLSFPAAERPSLITAYFDEVDTAGHDDGPDSPSLATAAAHLDDALGEMVAGVHALGLDDRTTFVVVSDHGMTPLSMDRVIYLDDYIDPSTVDIIERKGFLALAPRDGDIETLYRRLRGRHPALAIYKRDELPARLHYTGSPRIAPIIGIPRDGWAATTHEGLEERPLEAATHGYDPSDRAMGALFVAAGPPVRSGVVVEPFENVEVYNLLCAALRIVPAGNDGRGAIIRELLRDQ
jgi:predicted AlkP superfamily pyrophosphatase or phosphodiesterase